MKITNQTKGLKAIILLAMLMFSVQYGVANNIDSLTSNMDSLAKGHEGELILHFALAKPAGLDLQSKSNTTRICNPFFSMPIMKQMY
ncbi:MAG: hypothetical protein K9G64_06040 [Bacteroidia bacterium]|nr:hypothetical protein [Bacteroidia bacterium]